MANRHKSYDDVMVKKFEDLNYAQEYLLNMVDNEGLPVALALRECIKAMGLQSFAEKSGLSIQAISDFVSQRQKWSSDKLAKHISLVFKLKVKLAIELPGPNQVA